jgi:ribonuclease P protein component
VDRRRRIRREADFRRVRQQGRCWTADGLVVCALATGELVTRFGFVVGKRVGGAVVRNAVKRRLREIGRHLAPSLAPGYDIVVIARGTIAARTSQQLRQTLTDLARRARLWQPTGLVGSITAGPARAVTEGQ